ncbi:MAG: DUF2723 domain-containing protein [Kofleriaceae bacterium]
MLLDRGGAVALAALIVYVWIAPATIVDGDNAEFSTLGALGGRAHPTGYPLYVLYLRATSWLPGSSPAHTAGIATAVLAAALVLVLHAACRAWGARPVAATITCAIYAASPVVLRMHTEAEVFALNGLVAATVLWLAAADGPARGLRRAALLGLVAGLGIANHMTCVLVAPVGLLGVVRGVREARSSLIAVAASVAGLVVGLLPYAYLIVAEGPVSYGSVDGIADLLGFLSREDYGGAGAFAPTGTDVPVTTSLATLAQTLGRAWLWLPALAGVVELGLAIRRPRHDTRWGWIMVAVAFVLAGPLLASRFNLPPEDMGTYVLQRFHLLPMLLLAVPIAGALDRGWTAIEGRVRFDKLRKIGVATALVLVMFLALVATALPWLRAKHSPAMQRSIEAMVAAVPPRSVIIASGDDLCLGGEYVQHALGLRPDVDVICWGMYSRQWYRDRITARGIPPAPASPIAQALAIFPLGRPVFLSSQKQLALRSQRLPSYPFLGLVRMFPPGTKLPALAEIVAENKRAYATLVLDYPTPGREDDWATVAHMRYSVTWVLLSNALTASGDLREAENALAIARQLYPPAFEDPP